MKSNKLKWIVQISVLVLITFLGVLHQSVGGGTSGSPSVDSLCALGGLETLFSYLKSGTLIKKIELSSLVLLSILVFSGIFFGRAFCGFICPFGTLQEIFNKLGKKLGIKKYEFPLNIHKYLIYLKYLILAAVLALTWYAGELIIRPYDPWVAYMHIGGGIEAVLESPWAFVFLGLVLAGAMFTDRFFCKYLCPLGAFMSFFNKISIFKINKKPSCINCAKCSRVCPMNIDVKSLKNITSGECTMCTQCVASCPVKNTLVIQNTPGKNKKHISAASTIIIVLLLFALSVGTTRVTGILKTASATSEVLKDNSSGQNSPDNIKGYMTLDEISQSFSIPLDKLYSELKLPKTIPSDTKLKDIASKLQPDSGFTPDSARETVKKILVK